MSVRLRYKLDMAVSSTANEEKDLGHPICEVVVDSQGEGGVFKTKLAGGAVDQEIKLDNIASAKFLALRVTPVSENETMDSVKVRLNAIGGEEIEIKPLSGAREAHFLISSAGITALYVTNVSSSVAVAVTVVMAGD